MLRGLAVCLGLIALLAGCGGGGGSEPAVSGLARALASVRATPGTHEGVQWGDVAALRRLAKADARFWARLTGFGADVLAERAQEVRHLTALDVLGADTALTVGRPPHVATRLSGAALRLDAVRAKLKRLGARPQGRFLALTPEEGKIDLRSTLGPVTLARLDRVVIEDARIAFGGFAADVEPLLGGDPTLGDDPDVARAVACLGDPLAAQLVPPRELLSPGVALLGVGVGRPATPRSTGPERLCVVSVDAESADRLARRLRRALPDAVDPFSGRPFGERFARTSVSRPDPRVVRAELTLARGVAPGFALDTVARATVDALLGTPVRRP